MIFSRLSLVTAAVTAITASAAIGTSTAAAWGRDDNHGADVSAVATVDDKSSTDANSHGATVSAVARSNHGHSGADLLARLANAITFAGLTPVKTDVTTYVRLTNSSAAAGAA